MRSRIRWAAAIATAGLIAIMIVGTLGQVEPKRHPPVTSLPEPILPRVVVPYSTGLLPALNAPASDLLDYVRRIANARFAGLWLDPLAPFLFRVGIVSPTVRDVTSIQRALRSIGTAGTVVPMRFSERHLVQINSYLALRVATANRGATVPLSVGERPDLNAIEITLPTNSFVTPRQEAFAARAFRQFEAAVVLTKAPSVSPYPEVINRCRGVFCDPPLRSGIGTFTEAIGCTGGFIVRSRSDGLPYQLTAGHCRNLPYEVWLTNFANSQAHVIGPIHRSIYARSGDAGIIRIANPPGWRARGWVSVRSGTGTTTDETYPIYTDADPVVGIRVCVSGGSSGAGSCGVVTSVGVTASYLFLGKVTTVTGLARANFCASAGDSGSPVFAAHTAYGIVSGGAQSGPNECSSLFEPIRKVETLMNVNVLHEDP